MTDILEYPLRKVFQESLKQIQDSGDKIILTPNEHPPSIDIHDVIFYMGLSERDSIFTKDSYSNSKMANFRNYYNDGSLMFSRVDVVLRPKYLIDFKNKKY